MTPSPASIERLYELLAGQAVEPLSLAEEMELKALQAQWPHVEGQSFDQTAAEVFAIGSFGEAPPILAPELEARLLASATAPLASPSPPPKRRFAKLGWVVAGCLASYLLVSVGLLELTHYYHRGTMPQQRDQLLANGASRFTSKPGAISGEVVWDGITQKGFLEVSGLPVNNPTQKQYQLWIVDPGRTHKEPVDGGVFDITKDGTVLIPIRAALNLREPAVFAVTEEPPGGVVVSEKGRRGEFLVVMTAK
jgi:anti-sigma-K factor RskA